jgi:hypothetical protein
MTFIRVTPFCTRAHAHTSTRLWLFTDYVTARTTTQMTFTKDCQVIHPLRENVQGMTTDTLDGHFRVVQVIRQVAQTPGVGPIAGTWKRLNWNYSKRRVCGNMFSLLGWSPYFIIKNCWYRRWGAPIWKLTFWEQTVWFGGWGGGTRWRSWLRHCATSRKDAGSIRDEVTGICQWLNPSARTMALGSHSASNRTEYQESFLGGGGG